MKNKVSTWLFAFLTKVVINESQKGTSNKDKQNVLNNMNILIMPYADKTIMLQNAFLDLKMKQK